MEDAGFIVDDNIDELSILKYRYYKGKNSSAIINIALTLMCNFECPYCYEAANNKFIKNEVKEAIYKKIEDLVKKGEKITIVWFGGEPLLAKDTIKEMSEEINKICTNYRTKCVFDISTNGYLLDQSTIFQLLNWGVNTVQVTIDGIPEIHNTRRKLKSPSTSTDTFYKIVENIKTGLKMGMKFKVRINADKANASCLESLLKILAKEGLQDCFVYLACVRAYTKPKTANTLSTEEYSELFIEFSKLLKKNGFKHYDVLCYPSALFSNCSAGMENSFVIDPDGYMYRCLVEIGNVRNSYGNILDSNYEENNESMNNLKYLMYNPFEKKECIKCKVLPLCMGGCVYYALKNKNKLDCSRWKYNLEHNLAEIWKVVT